jgi:cobalt-zinc-cadmium efflux system membrane fusion protein
MNMNRIINIFVSFILLLLLFPACSGTRSGESAREETGSHEHGMEEHGEEGIHFSSEQFAALEMQIGALPQRTLSAIVEANGELEVPPQNEATVTAVIGANVTSIKVIEGDDVRKGQVLAYLSHPELTRLQSEYLEANNNLQFLEQEYQRQKRLYEEEVGAGKTFQRTQADYQSAQARVKSLALQLQQLGLEPERVRTGALYRQMPIVSPIHGTVTKVEVKTGQYVPPDKDLFEIVNIEHIHADLMVFEKDIYKVEKGQQVRFQVATLPGEELFARIYSVGKKFEQDPKALHVHAEIENKTGKLIPGMYIKGQILTDSLATDALPESAIVREGDRYLAFLAEKEMKAGREEWMFTPVEVIPGVTQDNWSGIRFAQPIPENARFALNNAYYLIAEMQKGEAEHSH